MIKTSIALALSLLATAASATMPPLTSKPSPATLEACQRWAASQDEDAQYTWGTLASGAEPSPDVGRLRLTMSCLGDPQPEIVGFGSSAGFNDAYCRRHPRQGICLKPH